GGVGGGRHGSGLRRQDGILPGRRDGTDRRCDNRAQQPTHHKETVMRGRDVFMQSLVAHGVEHIFGNPGTTESPLLDALAAWPSIDYVCHLHEGLAVGAASYYARASGRNAVVSLHVAPGLGNGI